MPCEKLFNKQAAAPQRHTAAAASSWQTSEQPHPPLFFCFFFPLNQKNVEAEEFVRGQSSSGRRARGYLLQAPQVKQPSW